MFFQRTRTTVPVIIPASADCHDVFLENSAATSRGGAGIKAAQTVVDTKAEALLTPRCGENAAQVIKAANIKIYKTINDSIQENIDAFNAGKLEVLNEIQEGFHGKGGQ